MLNFFQPRGSDWVSSATDPAVFFLQRLKLLNEAELAAIPCRYAGVDSSLLDLINGAFDDSSSAVSRYIRYLLQ